jgi:hypothetical protein
MEKSASPASLACHEQRRNIGNYYTPIISIQAEKGVLKYQQVGKRPGMPSRTPCGTGMTLTIARMRIGVIDTF